MADLPMLGGATGFVATGTPTTTTVSFTVDTSDAGAANYAPGEADRLSGMYLIVATGFQTAQMRAIVGSSVNGTTMVVECDAFKDAIAAGDTFFIGGRA